MDERERIARAATGDLVAARDLYEAHVDRVFRLAFRMTRNRELAEDLTQDTFVRAFTRLQTFRGDAAFSTWLHTIAVSVVLNGLRRVRRLRSHEEDFDAAESLGAPPPPADAHLRRRLAVALDALPESHRMVLVMHDLEGYSHEEIAAAMGMAAGTSRAQLSRARAKLRELLAETAREYES